MYVGLTVFTLSTIYALLLILEYFIFGRILVAGLTLVLLVVTMSMGLTMFSLGIIGSYVFRVYQEILQRPRYLVSQTINLTQS